MNHSSKAVEVYKQLASSEGGRMLIKWIEETSIKRRKDASRSQDTAYGELRFADGIEHVLNHIKTMSEYRSDDSKAS